jgi:hypothetical protein
VEGGAACEELSGGYSLEIKGLDIVFLHTGHINQNK